MDSELLLKFIRYFPDYLTASSRTLLRFFFFCRNSCISFLNQLREMSKFLWSLLNLIFRNEVSFLFRLVIDFLNQ